VLTKDSSRHILRKSLRSADARVRHVGQYHQVLMGLRQRSIESFSRQDEATVRDIFAHFERVLGPVGDSPQMRQEKRMPVRQSCGRASTRD
jgi:hypothetical protein